MEQLVLKSKKKEVSKKTTTYYEGDEATQKFGTGGRGWRVWNLLT